jgi:LacI family transcriptional regulator
MTEGSIAVTTKDIARIAGVSVSTVSRSLNDSPRISAETKERIKRIAVELDFEFDASARSLSTRRSGTVAFVIPAFLDRFANTLYLNLLIYDIRKRLAERGLDCIVTEALAPDGSSNVRRLVLQRKVDGVILLLESTRPEDWSIMKKRGIPVLHAHYMPNFLDTEGMDYFYTDNVKGGLVATEALLDSGCERVACLLDVCRNPEMADRERGYLNAHLARGLAPDPRLRFVSENSFADAYACVRNNLPAFKSADGVFVTTDIMALAVLRALTDSGVHIPDDCRLVGYDDIELCTYVKPTLTSVHQPREEIARLACDRLVYLLDGGPVDPYSQRLIVPTLVRRESC